MLCYRTIFTRYWTIPGSFKCLRAWSLALAVTCAVAPATARAAIETDPQALYATMREAYDRGAAKNWPFESELYYQTTILDAGRAYSLFRPADPNYAEVARLTIDVATQVHYNALANNDAAVWYVMEAASYVATNGDAAHQAAATALLARIGASETNPKVLAEQAEADALANVQAFHRDGDSLVALVIADVRALNLTHETAYRSALLKHAADPATPLARVPDPEYGQMFSLAASALADPGFTEDDRTAARAIKYRRDHTPELKVIGRVRAIPHELRLTRTAPADEYFGNLKYSPIGVRNEVIRINKYLDKGWGFRMENEALQVENAVSDWQKQYPHDATLPGTLLDAFKLLQRVETAKTKDAALRVKTVLLVQYADSRQAQEIAAS